MSNNDEALQNALMGNYNFTIKGIFTAAWKKVHGVKASIWGGIGIYIAIAIGITILLGIISALGDFMLLPADLWKQSIEHTIPFSQAPAAYIIFKNIMQLIEFILTICVELPMLAGLFLISMRWMSGQTKSAYYVTKFWKKAYILRFFMMWLWTMIALLIPMFIVGFISGAMGVVEFTLPLKALLITILVLVMLGWIYLLFGFVFAMPLIIDRFLKGGEALNVSRKVVTYHWFKIFFLFVFMGIILVISAIPLGIPLIWTLPWSYNVVAEAYKTIFGMAAKDPVTNLN